MSRNSFKDFIIFEDFKEFFLNFSDGMKENSLYDRKSLRAIYGPKANFKEIAKDCVGFANTQGGVIDFGSYP